MTTICLNNTKISVAATDLYTEATSRLKIKFQFSPDWDGLTKTATFSNGAMTVLEMARKYYPALWDDARLRALVNAGRLTQEEADSVRAEASPDPTEPTI